MVNSYASWHRRHGPAREVVSASPAGTVITEDEAHRIDDRDEVWRARSEPGGLRAEALSRSSRGCRLRTRPDLDPVPVAHLARDRHRAGAQAGSGGESQATVYG